MHPQVALLFFLIQMSGLRGVSSFSLRSASNEEGAVVTQASDPSDNAWIIRSKHRELNIPLDAPVDRPITRVFIVDGVGRAKDINVTLIKSPFEGLAFYDAHDFFKLIQLKNIRQNIQFEIQLKKPLIDKFKAHDQVKSFYFLS